MTDTFLTHTSPTLGDDGRFSWHVPGDWMQGRGAFGGLVAGACIRAMEQVVGEPERALRTISGTMCGPVAPGEATIEVATLRKGSGTSALTATITQGAEVRAHFVAVFGADREVTNGAWLEREPPQVPHWSELDSVALPPGMAPQFTRHVDFKVVGAYPFSGGERRESGGWVRFREGERGEARDAAYIAGLADCWWPTLFMVESTPRPMATIMYTLELLEPWGDLDPDAPLYYHARSPGGSGGFGVEVREMWDEHGRLVALNQQTITIIK
jgi:acyl-CoA thioesterase